MTERRSVVRRRRHRAAIAAAQPPCSLCGEPIDYDLPASHQMSFVVDHVIPLALGGPDTLENAAAAHKVCNARKGDRGDGGSVLRRSGSLRR